MRFFPDEASLLNSISEIEDVTHASFTERGLEVELRSRDSVSVVEVLHRIQRVFRSQIDTDESQSEEDEESAEEVTDDESGREKSYGY